MKRKSRFPTARMDLNGPRFQERKMSEESQLKTFCTQEVELQLSSNNESTTQKMCSSSYLAKRQYKKFVSATFCHGLCTSNLHKDISLSGNNQQLSLFWNSQYGPAIFQNTMGRDRFKLNLTYLRFENRSTTKRRENDRYAPLRDIWETVMKNYSNAFFPHGSVTIDEQLFACKSKCSFI